MKPFLLLQTDMFTIGTAVTNLAPGDKEDRKKCLWLVRLYQANYRYSHHEIFQYVQIGGIQHIIGKSQHHTGNYQHQSW